MDILLFFISAGLFMYLLDKYLHRWLGVNKVDLSTTKAWRVERWGSRLFFILFLLLLWSIDRTVENGFWLFISGIVAFNSFHALLEWMYIKNSRQFVVTLLLMVSVLLLLLAGHYVIL
ncbi:DUF4181 domain-containing protein [Bacillus sp. SB49]|uniref:DUF4181 domain-containing protein n=1 Tax=Bacillus sp. SB49 TaxID=1071080 RepID=UPI000412C43C|nr:DUF4181 domain-containing protein [Bacillus sp. SB49]QHT46218.1 DUF4181 domain-containing protein [Bacillus sp. SB49]